MIRITDLCKHYRIGNEVVKALDYATLHVQQGEFVSVIGPSGSTVVDHVVLFSGNDQDIPGAGDTQGGTGRPSGGGTSGGGMSGGSMSGGGMQSGAAQGSDEAEDSYAVSRTVLSYINPFDEAEIDIAVDEMDIGAYRVGQSVSVRLDALPGQSFTAAVRAIDPNGANEDGGNTKYTVTVVMPRTENMLSGMNATVRLESELRQNILTIPLAAVCEEDGRVFVYTSYDAETDTLGDEVEIETGLSDGELVEIISGLSEGDTYFYRYAETIKYNFQQ